MSFHNYSRDSAKQNHAITGKLKRLKEKLQEKDVLIQTNFKGEYRATTVSVNLVQDELEEFSREDIAELIIHLVVVHTPELIFGLEDQIEELEADVEDLREELASCEEELDLRAKENDDLVERLKKALEEKEEEKTDMKEKL